MQEVVRIIDHGIHIVPCTIQRIPVGFGIETTDIRTGGRYGIILKGRHFYIRIRIQAVGKRTAIHTVFCHCRIHFSHQGFGFLF